MAPIFNAISGVSPTMSLCARKPRLVHLYEPKSKKKRNFQYNMCLPQSVHAFMHETITNTVIDKFRQIVKEGHLFALKDIIIVQNHMFYKTTQNKYKFLVVKNSRVCESFEETFSSYMYEFISFGELKNQKVVDEIMRRYFLSRIFQGEISVSIAYQITKMLVNKYLDEIKDFRIRLSTEYNNPSTVSTTSLTIAHSLLEEITTSKGIFKTIQQIYENNEVGSFWVNVKIASVETHGKWYYFSCANCLKRVTPVGERLYYEKCNRFDSNGKMRHCKVLRLTKNMRLNLACDEGDEIKRFSDWISNIGDENIKEPNDGYVNIDISDEMLLKVCNDPIATIEESTYPLFGTTISDTTYFQ
ncbi:uncharacterized protein [Henckelia pumila]|uniref:uncharacterized protein n=1 Tax=Henckelia pumila TaxID=405737 RepID=UPI003C6DFAB9